MSLSARVYLGLLLFVAVAVLGLSVYLGLLPQKANHDPPKEYAYAAKYTDAIRVYSDPYDGRLYLYTSDLGVFPVGDLTIYDTVPSEN